MVDVIFLGDANEYGCYLWSPKAQGGPMQDKRAARKKGLDCWDKMKGKVVVIKIPISDQSLEDLAKHIPSIRPASEFASIFRP